MKKPSNPLPAFELFNWILEHDYDYWQARYIKNRDRYYGYRPSTEDVEYSNVIDMIYNAVFFTDIYRDSIISEVQNES